AEGDYHLGLEVKLRNLGGDTTFKYQLTGAHGMPIEGRWYTGKFRDVLVAKVDGYGNVQRHIYDSRELSQNGGVNDRPPRRPGERLRYAADAIQYFAAAIVVSDDQENQDFLDVARPTSQRYMTRGVVKSVDDRPKAAGLAGLAVGPLAAQAVGDRAF